MSKKDWTILEILKWTTDFFSSKNIPEAKFDAEVLLSYALNIKRLDLYLKHNDILKIDEIERFKNFIKKRIEHIPVAYIIEKKEFMNCTIKVSSDVLIPRYETEILVEEAIKIFDNFYKNNEKVNILDLCTGSGNIVISMAKALKKYKEKIFFYAVDISEKALSIAEENSFYNETSENVRFILGDLFRPIYSYPLEGALDIIISNPPYIRTKDIKFLSPDVKKEPILALDGGEDGLKFYRKIIKESGVFLKNNGFLILEIDDILAKSIFELLEKHNFYDIKIQKDYNSLERVVFARKKNIG